MRQHSDMPPAALLTRRRPLLLPLPLLHRPDQVRGEGREVLLEAGQQEASAEDARLQLHLTQAEPGIMAVRLLLGLR